mmetsp:Transcript_6410/g.12669  ORF Transcript_6410/g.12669 Transcript_6410/m.12669 type:complete len:108 (+) Transcript_6410:1217-1540(+)
MVLQVVKTVQQVKVQLRIEKVAKPVKLEVIVQKDFLVAQIVLLASTILTKEQKAVKTVLRGIIVLREKKSAQSVVKESTVKEEHLYAQIVQQESTVQMKEQKPTQHA